MKNTNRLRYLFQRYVSNTSSREEMEEFFDYVDDARQNADLRSVLDELWHSNAAPSLRIDTGERARRPYTWMAVAASVTIILVAGLWMATSNRMQNTPVAVHEELSVTSKSTQDERRLLTLPDGSSVWLNRDSKLEFPLDFSGTSREVQLTGEAFFDIRKDSLRPFIIYSGHVTTTVLGTAFNIRALPGENSITITVARGRVLVRDQQKHERIIQANQQISFVPDMTGLTPQPASVDSVSEWIHEDLILDNITFGEAATILEERYEVDVQFSTEALTHCRFTSTFLRDASLAEMLTAICIVNRATFRIENNVVSIEGEGCQTDQ